MALSKPAPWCLHGLEALPEAVAGQLRYSQGREDKAGRICFSFLKVCAAGRKQRLRKLLPYLFELLRNCWIQPAGNNCSALENLKDFQRG